MLSTVPILMYLAIRAFGTSFSSLHPCDDQRHQTRFSDPAISSTPFYILDVPSTGDFSLNMLSARHTQFSPRLLYGCQLL